MRINNINWFLGVSLFVHFAVFVGIKPVFPRVDMPVKPIFIYLGAFLGPQDLESVSLNPQGDGKNIHELNVNLDVRLKKSNDLQKPQWLQKNRNDTTKRQFKPAMPNEMAPQKKGESLDSSPEEGETFKPIRMRLEL